MRRWAKRKGIYFGHHGSMHRYARTVALGGFALLLSACARACNREDRQSLVVGETTFESIDGKVKVELVRTRG